ncbi:MAG: translation initiation factor IF-2 N-terminal domain-containing protein, partial [Thermoguttaceae bacterium]
MPIRIYALAKELQIDNKKLVDICTRAGITGKGSALASLTDEEAVRLKAFMAGGKGGKADGAAPARTADAALGRSIRREDYIAPTGTATGTKVPVLPAKHDKPPLQRKRPEEPAAPVRPAVDVPPAPAAPAAPPIAAMATVEPVAVVPPMAVVVSAAPASLESTAPAQETKAPVRSPAAMVPPVLVPPAPREVGPPSPPAPMGPVPPMTPQRTAMPGPLQRLLGKRAQDNKPSEKQAGERQGGERKAGEKKSAERTAPAMHLAPMPAQSKTLAKHKPKEPAPQKPDIKLPPDAIRASKAGSKPLSEHLRKHEEKKKRDDLAAKKGPSRAEAPEIGAGLQPLELAGGKDRPRRGPAKPVVAEDEREGAGLATLGGREQRQAKRKRSTTAKRHGGEDEESAGSSSRRTHIRRTGSTNTAAPRKGKVVVELPCTVRSFAEATGIPKGKILGKLLALGIVSNIAASLDAETAELLAVELGVEVDIRQEVSLEQKVLETADQTDPPESLKPRPPIVTFLGHVDHGKTSLLDRIIGLDVAAHEKGGITQHIRAYKVDKDGRAVTFVDTPGHEAFTEMRARGANVTDIAVLVVAADDGVMPQTEEAISHARAAGVPIVVALNKIDLPGVNVDRVYSQLAENQLLPSEWGGETEVVKTSATKGTGLDDLIVTLLTVAELHEYKANPDRPARGTCLEAEMHED